MADFSPLYKTGRYYTATGLTISSTEAMTAGRMYAMLMDFGEEGVTVDSLVVNVTTADAGTSVRMGYYAVASDGTPGDLLADIGTASVAATGLAEVADGETRSGAVYLVALFEGTPTVSRYVMTRNIRSVIGGTTSTSTESFFILAQAYGALPANMSGATASAIDAPAIQIKI